MDTSELVGLTVEEAIKRLTAAHLEYRITRRDGTPYSQTPDIKRKRVNLEIEKGKIVKATAA